MCDFVTVDVFVYTLREGIISQAAYTPDEVSKFQDARAELLDEWLEAIYGATNRLSSKEWLDKVAKDAIWIFSSDELR